MVEKVEDLQISKSLNAHNTRLAQLTWSETCDVDFYEDCVSESVSLYSVWNHHLSSLPSYLLSRQPVLYFPYPLLPWMERINLLAINCFLILFL